jgi:hypothetical protein
LLVDTAVSDEAVDLENLDHDEAPPDAWTESRRSEQLQTGAPVLQISSKTEIVRATAEFAMAKPIETIELELTTLWLGVVPADHELYRVRYSTINVKLSAQH